MIPAENDDPPVLPWRLVVGVLLHCIVPAYIAAMALACLLRGSREATAAELVSFVLRASAEFLIAYGALTTAAAFAARLLDPFLRRRRARCAAIDPAVAAARSQRRVSQALAQARRLAAGYPDYVRIDAAVTAIERGAWRHGDAAFRAVSADLDEAVRAFARAIETAPSDRRPAIADMAAVALERIAAALDALAADRGRLDEGDAHTVARYIELRYGSSDFTGEGPG